MSKRSHEAIRARVKADVVRKRLRTTGWTPAEYTAAFAAQDGRCAICGRHASELKTALHADHCHKTGTRRQLLCSACNTSIGQLQDDPTIIRRAADYVERWSS